MHTVICVGTRNQQTLSYNLTLRSAELGAQITTVSLSHCRASLWPNYYKVFRQTSEQELGPLASSARLKSIQWWQFGAVGPKS